MRRRRLRSTAALTGMSKVSCYHHKSRESEEAASQSRFSVENHSTTVQAGQANGKAGDIGEDGDILPSAVDKRISSPRV